MSGDLQFDIMTVQVEEAKEYMKQHKYTFKSIGHENSDQGTNDVIDNKIVYAKYTPLEPSLNTELSKKICLWFPDPSLSKKLNALAEDIKSKQLLFAQTEYLLRNIQIEHTLQCDIKLIIQNIMYLTSSVQRKFYKSNVLVMGENSPLATLGFVAQMLCAHDEVTIESTAHTAVLCHIFTTICHKAGLENVKLVFVENSSPLSNNIVKIPELQSGCIAVVTGKADIDSAVDAIINSPDSFPWKVRRVFVQECIGERLRQVLGGKCGLRGDDAVSSKEFVINGKKFLHECSGDSDGIIIEEYRTVKELMSLSKASFALSLWSSDVCEANEIAHGLPSNLVWINGFLEFSGPPATSQAFYSTLDVAFSTERILTSTKPLKSEKWSKMSVFARREVISRALENKDMSRIELPDLPDGSFASVDGGLLCIGIRRPLDSAYFTKEWRLDHVLSASLVGSTVLNVGERHDLSDALQDSDVPVNFDNTGDIVKKIPSILSMYRTKVVWTTFGTTFAN